MYASYKLCPKCKIRRFFVFHNSERVVFMVKKNGEIELIKPDENKLSDLNFSEIFCLGCSWKGSLKDLR